MNLHEINSLLRKLAPLELQESYDNAGLITGYPQMEITGVLIALDCTEQVIQEAIQLDCNLVIAHHPILFKPLKSLTGRNYVERTIISAVKNNIALLAMHTNLDNVYKGVNYEMARRIGLQNLRVLRPMNGSLSKLVTYVPIGHAEEVRQALFAAGAGSLGNYDSCSFSTKGTGTFRPLDGAKPYIGFNGNLEKTEEDRIELVFQSALKHDILKALKRSHPYEEVAFEVYTTDNSHPLTGAGLIGELTKTCKYSSFLDLITNQFGCQVIRCAGSTRDILKVAVCGGSGSFLLRDAIDAGADAFVSADFKYHEFFDAEDHIAILDIGHYESEQFTSKIIGDFLKEKLPTFAVRFSEVNTNPVKYHH